MSGHRLNRDLARGPNELRDPGNGKYIPANESLVVCNLSTGGAETRKLAAPNRSGILLTLHMIVDGGDCVVTSDVQLNQAGNTVATFEDVGDTLVLLSVQKPGANTHSWIILENIGSVGLA